MGDQRATEYIYDSLSEYGLYLDAEVKRLLPEQLNKKMC